MLIYGGGGYASVLVSCLRAKGVEIHGIFDDNPWVVLPKGMIYLGPYDEKTYPCKSLILGIGDLATRIRLEHTIKHGFGQLVHPSAIVDASVSIGLGGVVLHGAVVQAGSMLGDQVIINTKASVDHDCRIANFVHLAPGVILCGGVVIGANTMVGAGSVVVPGISVGSGCLIAAGSVVTRNIPNNCLVRGNPARVIGSCKTNYV